MENKKSKKHVQLPKKEPTDNITAQDQLVYVNIKRFANHNSLEAFPSLTTICSKCGASEPTIRKCIKHLIAAGYMKIRKATKKDNVDLRQHIYVFNELKKFEPFSDEFLDNPNLSFLEKSYIISSQQYMYKNPADKTGKISLSTRELQAKTGLSQSSIVRCQHSLEKSGNISIIKSKTKDGETNCLKSEQIFYLDKLGQDIVFTLTNHEERIQKTENKVETLEERVERLEKLIRQKDKQLADAVRLEQQVLEENKKLKGTKQLNKIIAL